MENVAGDDTDVALRRVWELFVEDPTDKIEDEMEALLPTLIVAGYVDATEDRWNFTPKGVARAKQLESDAGTEM